MSGIAGVAGRADGMQARYRVRVGRRLAVLALLMLAGLGAMVADLLIGSGTLSLRTVLAALVSPHAVDDGTRAILWDIRMPITLTAAFAGIGLALAGTLMQTALNNPLAEPFTLGISSAAGFGAAMAIVFQTSVGGVLAFIPGELFVSANAFLFSLGTVVFVSLFALRAGLGVETVTLLGIAIHFVFAALLALAQFTANADQLQTLVFWLMGSLTRATWLKFWIVAGVVALVLPVVLARAWAMTALRGFGDNAAALGLRVARLRFAMMVAAALLAGVVTSTIGIVGFVGLVAPHMARMLVGEDQRFSLAVTAACGLLVMVAASLASKLVIPGTMLPIGMVTSLLGVPFFLVQILGTARRRARRG